MTLVLACKTFKAAPVPRPPQPTTPTRIGSGAAIPYRRLTNGKGIAVATPAARDFFRKLRRGIPCLASISDGFPDFISVPPSEDGMAPLTSFGMVAMPQATEIEA